jgi:membrane-associated PAP2 superfamily phosphatase
MRLLSGLALAALGIAWLGNRTDVDLVLANAMYDAERHAFPWRHTWLAETFGHFILKALLVCTGALAMVAVTWDLLRPFKHWSNAMRLRSRILACSALGVPLVTSLLKQASVSHCPWDLALYGGTEPYVRLFEALPSGALAGHCLPAGHASSALWLVAIGVFWLPYSPRKAFAASACGLAAGFVLGWLQQLRGAHFLTHTLWSMWIACAVVVAIISILQQVGSARQRMQNNAMA